jgi:hypothetical protein
VSEDTLTLDKFGTTKIWDGLGEDFVFRMERDNYGTRPVRFIKRWKYNGAKLETELGQCPTKKWGSVHFGIGLRRMCTGTVADHLPTDLRRTAMFPSPGLSVVAINSPMHRNLEIGGKK